MSRQPSPGDYLTLDETLECSRRLAELVAATGFHPEVVVGIREGGLLPAHVVASTLGARFSSLSVRRPASGFKHSRLGRLIARLVSSLYHRSHAVRRLAEFANRSAARDVQVPPQGATRSNERRVLLVDDFCQSGATLSAARRAVSRDNTIEVRVAVITWREGRKPAVLEPDFRLFEIWLHFPWSTDSPDYAAYLEWRRVHLGEVG